METLKGAALFLSSSARSSAQDFSSRRDELLSGRRSGAASLTARSSDWVREIVAANDIEEQLALEAQEGYVEEEARDEAQATRAVPRQAVTMAVGPDEPIDDRRLPPRKQPVRPVLITSAAVLPPPAAAAPTVFAEEAEEADEDLDARPSGPSALDRMAAFLSQVSCESPQKRADVTTAPSARMEPAPPAVPAPPAASMAAAAKPALAAASDESAWRDPGRGGHPSGSGSCGQCSGGGGGGHSTGQPAVKGRIFSFAPAVDDEEPDADVVHELAAARPSTPPPPPAATRQPIVPGPRSPAAPPAQPSKLVPPRHSPPPAVASARPALARPPAAPPPPREAVTADVVLPVAIDDWLEDLDSDVEELPSVDGPPLPRAEPVSLS